MTGRTWLLGLSLTLALPAAAEERLVYFGTHGNAIYAARFDDKSGHLTPLGQVVEIERPTWQAVNSAKGVLYSVSELGNNGLDDAMVLSLKIDQATGKLQPLNKVASGGAGATHLDYDATLKTLFVANFGGGQVSSLPVHEDGSLGPVSSVQSDFGTGPHPRQSGPHAHAVAVDPGHHFLLSADLGADRLFVYRYDAATRNLTPADPAFVQLPAGFGPRHLAFLPNGKFLYMNNELSAQIQSFRWDGATGHLQPIETVSALSPSYRGEKSAAELAVSKDGKFLYLSNRGEDSVVVYSIDQESGKLTERQRIPAQGKTPWGFAFDSGETWLLVANEASGTVNVLKRDPATGKLSETAESLPVPRPVAVTFFPE